MIISLLLLFFSPALQSSSGEIHIGVSESRMPLHIMVMGKTSDYQESIIKRIIDDLSSGDHFVISVERGKEIRHKREIEELFKKGYPLVIFLSIEGLVIEWRAYDAVDSKMLKGKRYIIEPRITPSALAHGIAHDMWTALTGLPDAFLSMISYIHKPKHKKQSELWVCSYNGKDHRKVFQSPRIVIAPSWDRSADDPHIIVSEFTPANVRLRAINLMGKNKVIFDVDGTSVGISYVPHHDDVVYCRSGDIWHFHYDPVHKQGVHRLVIHEPEPCASPIVLTHHDIIYACKGSIRLYDNKTGACRSLTTGYCVAPTYHEARKRLVYSKREQGVMQLFMLEGETGVERQLTFDAGDKTEPSLSPCGTTVACCHELSRAGRIMLVNIQTGRIRYITEAGDDCRYPAWSASLAVHQLL